MTPHRDFEPKNFGILIVDDDPDAIRLLRTALHAYPDVRFATNGADALRLARERTPAMVLLDGEMPDQSGFQVCQMLKGDPPLQDVPVIFVTAHDQLEFETRAIQFGAADFIAKPVSPLLVQLRVQLHLQLKDQLDQLKQLAMTDGLTQLPNRRAFDEVLAREWRRSMRNHLPLSLILADVDFFKRFNDRYGHPAGDECLKRVANAVRGVARRPTDGASRFGGEEFALVLAETPPDGARTVANNLLASLHQAAYPHAASEVAKHVTLSIGIASTGGHGGPADDPKGQQTLLAQASADDLVRAADRALYIAKARGRNRAEFVSIADLLLGDAGHE